MVSCNLGHQISLASCKNQEQHSWAVAMAADRIKLKEMMSLKVHWNVKR